MLYGLKGLFFTIHRKNVGGHYVATIKVAQCLIIIIIIRRSGYLDVGDVICRVNGLDVTRLRQRDVMTLLEMTSRHRSHPVVLTVLRSAASISGKLTVASPAL